MSIDPPLRAFPVHEVQMIKSVDGANGKSSPFAVFAKSSDEILKRIATFGLVLIMGVSISACGAGSEKWNEEVLLSDGRIIVIEREQLNERGGDEWAFNRSGSKPKEYRIRFHGAEGAEKIKEWRSIKMSPRTWPETPLAFDIYKGQPIIFTSVAVSNCCEVYSKYIYRNGIWIEEILPEHFEERPTNLFFGSRKDLPSLINLEEKENRNSGSGYRQALKQIGPNRTVKFP